jgi:hypothetical protein
MLHGLEVARGDRGSVSPPRIGEDRLKRVGGGRKRKVHPGMLGVGDIKCRGNFSPKQSE